MANEDFTAIGKAIELTHRADALDIDIAWADNTWKAFWRGKPSLITMGFTLSELRCLIMGIEWAMQKPDEEE